MCNVGIKYVVVYSKLLCQSQIYYMHAYPTTNSQYVLRLSLFSIVFCFFFCVVLLVVEIYYIDSCSTWCTTKQLIIEKVTGYTLATIVTNWCSLYVRTSRVAVHIFTNGRCSTELGTHFSTEIQIQPSHIGKSARRFQCISNRKIRLDFPLLSIS